MGEVLIFNPLGWPEDLAPGAAAEVEHVGSVHGVRVSVASQDAAPGYLHVVTTDELTMGATAVAVVPDSDGGRKLARFVARAILRSLDAVSWVPRPPATTLEEQ